MHKTINNIHSNIWVSASAGSGKTKVLIDRFIKLLLNGVNPEKIVCITFTKAAATEMIERIYQTLGLWSICSDMDLKTHLTALLEISPTPSLEQKARGLLLNLLDAQHNLQIKTIHSFCQTILTKFPIEADIGINAQILEGSELEKIRSLAYKNTISEYQTTLFTREIDYLLSNISDTQLIEIFEQHLFINEQYPDFFNDIGDLQKYAENLYKKFGITKNLNINLEKQILLEKISSLALQHKSILNTEIPILNSLLELQISHNLTNLLPYFFTSLGMPRKKLLSKKDASEESLDLLTDIQNLLIEFESKRIALKVSKQTEGFLFLGHLFINIYSTTKKQNQCLDYNDLLYYTLKLLSNNEIYNWIQYKLYYKIEHLLVDEAQDTNILQWKIIEQIQAIFLQNNNDKNCTIFVVGDPKQSIYSFQGTSPEIFDAMKDINVKAEHNWIECQLNTSYRSDQIILDFIDSVFNSITKSSPHLFYTPDLKHYSSTNFNVSSIELLPIILGNKNDKTGDNAWQALQNYVDLPYEPSQILAAILAEKVKELLATGQYYPSDFLILIRKRDKLTKNIINEFKKLHIPISGIDRINLNSSLAVQDLVSVLSFVLLPQDNYNLACLLKSPFFKISEEELEALSQSENPSIWNKISDLKNTNARYQDFYTTLSYFIDLSLKSSVFDLFVEVLDVLSYRRNFIEYFGHQINEILDEFLNICQVFQKNDMSITNFVYWFNNSNLEIKREALSGRNEVRIMTVHASKGLQAKYVILPDTVNVPSNKNSIILNVKDKLCVYKTEPIQNISEYFESLIEMENNEILKEYFRLLYVALTRAQQHLLICGWTNTHSISDNSWFKKLNDIMQKKESIEAPAVMGYLNVNFEEKPNNDNQKFFWSNSDKIFYIKK